MIREIDDPTKSSKDEIKSLVEIIKFHNKFYEYFN